MLLLLIMTTIMMTLMIEIEIFKINIKGADDDDYDGD